MRADLGVMISASHNESRDNGIKFFDPDGYKLSDEMEAKMEAMIAGPSEKLMVPAEQIGRAKRIESAQERYIEFAKRTLPKDVRLDGLRIVIDCANGAGYQVAPNALWELGAEVIKIGVDPNGHNINLKCGSTAPQTLCEKVKEVRADIGIALDGDADRVVIVDEKGQVVDGDQIMAVIAESWHRNGTLHAGGVVATVMSNLGLEHYLNDLGLTLARTAVGDRYVTEHMRKHGFNLGGEQSGHIVLSDFTTTGDGLVCALQVLAVAVTTGKPVSEVCRRFVRLPQVLKNVRYANGAPLEKDAVIKAIEGGKARLGNRGRVVIRPSGTEPVIRVMAEGDDQHLVNQVVDDIVGAVQKAAAAG
jgi:phosphoglucosamine mutase